MITRSIAPPFVCLFDQKLLKKNRLGCRDRFGPNIIKVVAILVIFGLLKICDFLSISNLWSLWLSYRIWQEKGSHNDGSKMLATRNVGYGNQLGVATALRRRRHRIAAASPRRHDAAATPPRRSSNAGAMRQRRCGVAVVTPWRRMMW